jgi:outer membrane protein assembly factor BamB
MTRFGGRARWLVALAAAALAVPAGATTAYGSGPAGDWRQADHDASANRANTTATQITAANAATLTWRRGLVSAPAGPNDQCGEGWSTPVIANKRVYAVQTGRVTARDLATGATVWQRALRSGVVTDLSGVFAISNGRVLVGMLDCISQSDPSGSVRAFDAATGAPLWTASVDGFLGLAVSGDRVVAYGYGGGAGNTVFRVLSASTGALVWERDLGDGCGIAASAIVVYDRVYYQACESGQLTAARLTDGVVAWHRPAGPLPVRGDAVGTVAKHLYLETTDVNPATGATRFTLAGAGRVFAVDATRVYASCSSVVCAYSRATGARLWMSTEPVAFDPRAAEPALAGTLLYTPTGAVLDAATGAEVTRLWSGEARELSVGNGYVTAVLTPRVLDVYGLPGS